MEPIDPPDTDPRDLFQTQLQLEANARSLGVERYQRASKTALGNEKELKDQPVGQMMTRLWVAPMADALKDALGQTRGSVDARRAREEIKALQLTTYELSYLTITSVLKLHLIKSRQDVNKSLQGVAVRLGRALILEVKAREFAETHGAYCASVLKSHQMIKRSPERILKVLLEGKQRICGDTEIDVQMSNLDAYRMGIELIKVFLAVAPEWFVRTTGRKNRLAEIVMTTKCREWIQSRTNIAQELRPLRQPMVVPPVDWASDGVGGYLTIKSPQILGCNTNPRVDHTTQPSLENIKAINVAQRTAWRVNKRVLKVAQQLQRRGQGHAGLHGFVDVPDEVGVNPAWSKEALKDFRGAQRIAIQANIKAACLITTDQVKIDTAEDFSSYEAIYFPHTFDWRGRMYPLPILINPQGDDLAKGLLEFSKGAPLGTDGYRWLAIHCANTYGEDKLSYADRIKWTEDNEDEMLRCSLDPFSNKFWMDADDPFKFLACCFEWGDLIQHEGAITEFISRIPIALDGTCSGLQHFSALLKDSRGGASVNLVPSGTPNDIYKEVAEEVLGIIGQGNCGLPIPSGFWYTRAKGNGWETVANTSKRGVKSFGPRYGSYHNTLAEAQAEADALNRSEGLQLNTDCWQARVWEGLINRGTTKRGVMTRPYSVTQRGMSEQLFELIRSEPEYQLVFERAKFEAARVRDKMSDEVWLAHKGKPSAASACSWLAKILQDATDKVVVASRDGQSFLVGLADAYSKAGMFFSWETPMGMSITQGYRKPKEVAVATYFGGTRVRLNLLDDTGEIPRNGRKNKSGASPNWIHSMDATHLMMAVIECYDRGGIKDFALVHDSFGVHAGHAQVLSQALRHTFADMYKSNHLRELWDRAVLMVPEEFHEFLPEVPAMGTLDLEVVRRSNYLFC